MNCVMGDGIGLCVSQFNSETPVRGEFKYDELSGGVRKKRRAFPRKPDLEGGNFNGWLGLQLYGDV